MKEEDLIGKTIWVLFCIVFLPFMIIIGIGHGILESLVFSYNVAFHMGNMEKNTNDIIRFNRGLFIANSDKIYDYLESRGY